MKYTLSILTFAICLGVATNGFAIDSKMQMNGAGFSNACKRADENWVSFCNGYIQAVIDSVREDDRVCLLLQASYEQ